MKIFKFGSCRTSIKNYTIHDIIYNYCHTHSTKEIIQYIDFFYGRKNIKDSLIPEGIMNNHDNFDANKYKLYLEDADIVYIEISSINEVIDTNNFYYQLNYINKFDINKLINEKMVIRNKTNIKSIIHDIHIIKQMINKPLIIQGHINLYFEGIDNLKNKNYIIEEREIIDKAIYNTGFKCIILKDLFKNYHWTEICDCSIKIDLNHFTEFGYKLIGNKFDELIKNNDY
jgi:hypothetical protein